MRCGPNLSCVFLGLSVLAICRGAVGLGTASDRPAVFPVSAQASEWVIVGSVTSSAAAGDGDRLVYSNTLGRFAIQLRASQLVADDIVTTASADCRLTRYRFEVVGQVDPEGIGGAYGVTFGLYTTCPQAGGVPIPGAGGDIQFPDGGRRTIEFIIGPDVELPDAGHFWLAVRFDRNNCGVVMGAPPLVGFSADQFDYPLLNCHGDVGGFPNFPHASFNADVFSEATCSPAFVGYYNANPGAAAYNRGVDVWFAEDLELGVPDCNLIGYEVAVRGTSSFETQLHYDANGLPGAAIQGTNGSFDAAGTGANIVRIDIDPPVALSGEPNKVWLALRPTQAEGTWLQPEGDGVVGRTDDMVAVQEKPGVWSLEPAEEFENAGYYAVLTCAGEPPTGACCDMAITQCVGGSLDGVPCAGNEDCDPPGTCESVCREVPQMNCPFPPRDSGLMPEWMEGAVCDPEPFPERCGAAACCTPEDTCENLTKNECDALPPVEDTRQWQRGLYCGEGGPSCLFHACLQREGECVRARAGRGCLDPDCCQDTCEADVWCCRVQWDELCLLGTITQRYCAGNRIGRCTDAVHFDMENGEKANGSIVISNSNNPQLPPGLGFSCHPIVPGARGEGAVWLAFTAAYDSARIHTCNTLPPSDDTLLAVYSVGDPSTPETACATLTELACSDNVLGCGTGRGSDICVSGLTPGDVYYVQVASPLPEDTGVIRVDLESPCPTATAMEDEGESAASMEAGTSVQGTEAVESVTNATTLQALGQVSPERRGPLHHEVPNDPYMPRPDVPPPGVGTHAGTIVRNGYASVQVNVDEFGRNIPGDAANEPSIAIDPTDPRRMVIGWRQFDSVESDFRQAGYAYSHDGGSTWTFPGVLEPEVFRSDPVLGSDTKGSFYYYSLNGGLTCDLFRSVDGGMTWDRKTPAFGGDKPWMAIDRTGGIGDGNIYTAASFSGSARSTDGGATFHLAPVAAVHWGTISVSSDGTVYSVLADGRVTRSSSARDASLTPTAEQFTSANLEGVLWPGAAPNPGGLPGQVWIAAEPPGGPHPKNVYLLSSIIPARGDDPLDVMFARSRDRGETWSQAVRVNDDPAGSNNWQWFGTMSVAPTGRIDVIWNDTRASGIARFSELYYSYSVDEGRTWSANLAVSPVFDSYLGWPHQSKLGDYYDAISDETGMNVAYAATFNGEQDVYSLRIEPFLDCDRNRIYDPDQVKNGDSPDCNGNRVPDECERDLDGDGLIDDCDPDLDGDGIENVGDRCPYTLGGPRVNDAGVPRVDTNENCAVDQADFWRLRNCLVGGRPGFAAPIEACLRAFDADGDGTVRLRDFAEFQNVFGRARP